MLKQQLRLVLIILGFIIVSYSWVWLQSYNRSKEYYEMAMSNFEKGDYIVAIKGKRVLKEDESGYIYQGGLQQALEIWDSPYAIPKPNIYLEAELQIDHIINEKIDLGMGKDAFKSYFQLDNRYLPEILIRVGELYEEQNEMNKAIEIYTIVKDAFVYDKAMVNEAIQKIEQLEMD
ncbi:hypothetical protein [Vallitalea okinawensis]|uniref:hypothetical protein n=1 Tax=Vallitalea okinawensis TaxID=2078660 RepID=UPI000CFE2574|nr:hypothetical protein [Vallitalea okinawensis]